MTNKKSLHYSIHTFAVEPENLDFIKATAHRLNERAAFGKFSKSNVVNHGLSMIRESDTLTDRLTARIERKKLARQAKMVKKYHPSYQNRLRRSERFKESKNAK